MRKIIAVLILSILLFNKSVLSQECSYINLSKKYNYKVLAIKSKNDNNDLAISHIRIKIILKANNKTVQLINIKPGFLFDDVFKNSKVSRSFITGFNKDESIVDGDSGDFIVADFNFDGKEDFAIKDDSGGNGGPTYKYFTINETETFEEDIFLSSEVSHFPSEINAANKTIVTYVHANAAGYNENIFKFNHTTRTWKLWKSTFKKA